VIGTRKGMIAKVDSVQALKNIQNMIEEARKVYEDSIYNPIETEAVLTKADSASRPSIKIEGVTKTKSLPKKDAMKPKAVMKKGEW
jgi:hypothetical protein